MEWTYLLTLVTLSIGLCNSKIRCNKKDKNCFCIPSQVETELQCPPDFNEVGGFVIHIDNEQNIRIDCTEPYPQFFNVDLLPNISLGMSPNFQIRFCPLPEKNFKNIFDKFSATNVKYLRFESFNNNENVTWNKTYFEELITLENLTLDANGIVDLDEDVFANTPNLIDIDLGRNSIKLKSTLFHPTPLLKSLDISENRLEMLPKGLFQNLKYLENLLLWNNKLSTIDEFTFDGLSNLKVLEASLNHISNISENAFRNLANLRKINFSKNKLTALPSRLLQDNKMLRLVILNENFNLSLPNYLFSNLDLLQEIQIKNCHLMSIPAQIFENSSKIETLNLDNNLLNYLPENLFEGLNNLKELSVKNNKLSELTTFPHSLRKLNLQRNLISSIGEDTLSNLKNLEELNLRSNRISVIHHIAFDGAGSLKIIDLSHNQISATGINKNISPLINYSILKNVVELEDVNLSYNFITNIENVIDLSNKVKLKKLDLRHNNINGLSIRDLLAYTKLEVKLDWNNITNVDFYLADVVGPDEQFVDGYHGGHAPHTVIFLSNNPLECNCRNYDLFRYFHDELSPKVRVMFEISSKNLTCSSPYYFENFSVKDFHPSHAKCLIEEVESNYEGCPEECTCYWRPSDKSFVVDCSSNNYIFLPDIVLPEQILYSQTEIHFEHNNLTEGPTRNMTSYNNVTKMYLGDNSIKTIEWLPSKLQVLELHNNSLSNLDYEVLKTLNTSSLLNLTLSNNPWTCDCDAENLTNFLRQKRQIDASHIYCVNTTTRLIGLSGSDLCPPNLSILYIILPVLSILLALAIVAAVYYRYQQELKIWLYAKDLCLWWVTEEDLDKDKIYDAFISYSHKDEDFVNQNLLPVLEGKEGYKLCLHYRNWIPGEFISKQVTTSVCESRRTVVVLSPNFLESVWGKLEFRTAHSQAMTEGRARVIILLYGDVDINSLDSELKSYMKTNTYVKWGDPYFWNKLKYALPHSKKRISNRHQKHANLMNFIDEKFNLVTPVSGSPGSTPPVLTLDPGLLKKHPLSFVPNSDMDTPPAESGTLLTVIPS